MRISKTAAARLTPPGSTRAVTVRVSDAGTWAGATKRVRGGLRAGAPVVRTIADPPGYACHRVLRALAARYGGRMLTEPPSPRDGSGYLDPAAGMMY